MLWQIRTYWGRQVRLVLPDKDCQLRLEQILPAISGENAASEFSPGQGEAGDTTFIIERSGNTFSLHLDNEPLAIQADWVAMTERLEWAFQNDLGCHAPDAVFVHSGVVTLGTKALLLPACSYSGKSTMTHALTKLGATYFSDEFAVIDHEGWVHPYRRPMTIRREDGGPDRRVSSFDLPLPTKRSRISLIVDCQFEKGARWNPKPLSQGEGVLALFSNTVSAQLTPQRDIAWLTNAMKNAQAYRSLRGDVRHVAPKLLAMLEQS